MLKQKYKQMSEICCICLEETKFRQNINECIFGTVKYIEKLEACLPLQVWDEAFAICNECVDKLDSAYSFVQLCLRSEDYRKQLKIVDCSNIKVPEEESLNFTCHQCSKSFRLKRALSIHIARSHNKTKRKVKKEVENKCFSEPSIKTEREQSVSVKYESKIEYSNKKEVFESETGKENIEDLKPFPDLEDNFNDDNDSNFPSEEEIVIEKKTKGKKRGPRCKGPFKCEFCELVFNRTDRFMQHIRSKHTFEKPFKCDLCDARYFSQHNLTIHHRKHTNEKPYVCSTCGKSFKSSNDLWQHNKTHERVRQYGCNECEKSFKTHSNLRTHKLQMHQDPGMWRFICTICGKKFPLNNNLVKHMRRHEGIKQFSCHLCEKKFVEKIDLQTHLVSHSNERNYKCSVCEKDYKKKETLRRHMKIEHDIGNFIVKKPEKKFNCPMCPKIFAFNNKLQRHILTHTGERPVKCEYCEKRFRDNYDRNVHLRKDHNVDPRNSLLQI